MASNSSQELQTAASNNALHIQPKPLFLPFVCVTVHMVVLYMFVDGPRSLSGNAIGRGYYTMFCASVQSGSRVECCSMLFKAGLRVEQYMCNWSATGVGMEGAAERKHAGKEGQVQEVDGQEMLQKCATGKLETITTFVCSGWLCMAHLQSYPIASSRRCVACHAAVPLPFTRLPLLLV